MAATLTSLQAWARGSLPLEAAVHLVGTALGGRLLHGPWVRREGDGTVWLDADASSAGHGLSGGKRRVLAIALSLAGGEPVDLSDALCGIDHDALTAVLSAMAHAAGTTIDLTSERSS